MGMVGWARGWPLITIGCVVTLTHVTIKVAIQNVSSGQMGAEFKHLVLVKFKNDVVVEDVLKGMEKLVSEMAVVKSFVWGKDMESQEMLTQGFTHAFLMTFSNKDDFLAYVSHPKHVEFSSIFSTAIEKALLLDFPAVTVKPAAA